MLLACVLSLGSLTAAFAEAPAEQEPPAAAGPAEPIDTPLSETDRPTAPPAGDPEPPETPPAEPQPGEPEPAGPEAPEKADPDLPEGSGEESDADPEDPQEPGELPVMANALAAPVPVNAPEAEEAEIRSVTVSPEQIKNGGTVTVTVEMYCPWTPDKKEGVWLNFMHTDDPDRTFLVRCLTVKASEENHIYSLVGTIDVKPYNYSGTYRLEYMDNQITNRDYCSARYKEHQSVHFSILPLPEGWQKSFTVENKFSDEDAPILEEIIFDLNPVVMEGEDKDVPIRLKVKSGSSGVNYIEGAVANENFPDKEYDFKVINFSQSQTENGYYEAVITIPKYASAGDYHLTSLHLGNINENYRTYYSKINENDYKGEPGCEELTDILANAHFEVTNLHGDDHPPILEKVEIRPDHVAAGSAEKGGGYDFEIILTVTDGGGSGFNPESPNDAIIMESLSGGDRIKTRAEYKGPGSEVNTYD